MPSADGCSSKRTARAENGDTPTHPPAPPRELPPPPPSTPTLRLRAALLVLDFDDESSLGLRTLLLRCRVKHVRRGRCCRLKSRLVLSCLDLVFWHFDSRASSTTCSCPQSCVIHGDSRTQVNCISWQACAVLLRKIQTIGRRLHAYRCVSLFLYPSHTHTHYVPRYHPPSFHSRPSLSPRRLFVSPICLKCSEGKRLLVYLFGLHPSLVLDIHEVMKGQMPGAKRTVLAAYGEVSHKKQKEKRVYGDAQL